MIKQFLIFGILSVLLGSCSVLQNMSKKGLGNGFYNEQSSSKERRKVYIDIQDDETICAYATKNNNGQLVIDTSQACQLYSQELKKDLTQTIILSKPSFDIDFLTIPLKYRPKQTDVPAQLNANLNGAFYFGYRTDKYVINYNATPVGKANRNINHFGFSMGAFTGIGTTFMSPTNTNNHLQQEYDGIVWSKGIASIFAANNFTVGLSVGFDNLLDKNHNIWIYQTKTWLGLAFGLNLN
ncbi:hypothetical protein SAMN05421780_102461 [Flexibacter flexilis DSM 6793]|uniref:Uncharacterized protein n=1 Tax=Flexibacter flexilis DSM 6793 TaxID=927664 RepID=A0A1I1GAM1_9BACT|nr:hypothetical protein [Flexibacter flexilis]SFC06888.1 hypothetical protein SAMN05421780_102461 [Flexibacter flexilis DSM 6793]